MATRLYFGNDAAAVTPSITAGWELTTGYILRTLETGKGQPLSAYETRAQATTLNSPAGAVDVLLAQYVSAPLSGNVTIAGAIRGQIMAFESNAAANAVIQVVIWVVKTDGTVRGTPITFNAAALSNELNTSTRNISLPRGGSTVPTSTGALATDRIVVELGWRKLESATTSRTVTIESGNPTGSDLPVDETTTTQGVPWIEFTEALSFDTVTTRASDVVSQVAILPTTVDTRVSDVVAQAAVTPPTVTTRTSLVVAQVAVLLSGAVPGSSATPRAWGYILD